MDAFLRKGHACRASGRLGSMSETESAILNSVVAEEDEEGEESNSTAFDGKHMPGALCSLVWHRRARQRQSPVRGFMAVLRLPRSLVSMTGG